MGNDLIRSAKDYSLNTTIERLENVNKFILDDKGRVKECFASLLDTSFKSLVRLKTKQDEYRYNQFCSMLESLADYLLFSREEKERNNQERGKFGVGEEGYSYLTAERQEFINDKERPYSPCDGDSHDIKSSSSSKVEHNTDSPLQKQVSNTLSQSLTNVYHKKKREQEENKICVERGKMFAELYQRIDKEPHNREEIQRQIETLENTKVLISDLKIHINYISRDSRFIYELDKIIKIYSDAIKRGTFQNSALQPTQQSINGYTYQIHEDGEKIPSNKLGLLRYVRRELQKEKKAIKAQISKGIYFLNVLPSSTEYDFGFFSWGDEKCIFSFLSMLKEIKDFIKRNPQSNLSSMYHDFQNIYSRAKLTDIERDIVLLKNMDMPTCELKKYLPSYNKKIDDAEFEGNRAKAEEVIVKYDKNSYKQIEIVEFLNNKYQSDFEKYHVTRLWRNSIPRKIKLAYKEYKEEWLYTYVLKGEYKKCSRCGKIWLTKHFAKNRNSKDGLRSICKECR